MNYCVNAKCSLWVTFFTCYWTLIQLMLHANIWKVVKIMIKQYYDSCKKFKVEIFSMSKYFHYYKIQHKGKNLMLVNNVVIVSLWNYAQITNKNFHLLFVHDDNKSNSGQIGQVVAMSGSGKTQDFFLWHKSSWVTNLTKAYIAWALKNSLLTHLYSIFLSVARL
jgi:hypothetical protein